jgi:(p)ppGpp synthase/HD superfamily hydrolase
MQAFPDKLKDYIANPKANGYQSIHTIIYSRSINCPVEVQVRTEEMHKLAEFGVAAHWKYKNLKEDKKFEKKISWLREVLQWEKEHKDNIEFLNLLKYDFFQNEIFVFTPKNDIIFLPEGSSVLDFAYGVHTEVGSKASKAKVNGAFTTIDKILKNGDIVEIITSPSVKPNEKWLKFVKTSKAKLKIRDDMNLKFKKTPNREKTETSSEALFSRLTRVNEFKKLRKAGCCGIEYGDQIVGVVGKGNELVIHNASCDNAKYAINKKIPLNWVEERKKEVEIIMHLKDRFGLLIDILNVFSEFNLNVSKLNTKIFKNGKVKMDLKVADGPYMERLIEKLRELDSVETITISRGLFG